MIIGWYLKVQQHLMEEATEICENLGLHSLYKPSFELDWKLYTPF